MSKTKKITIVISLVVLLSLLVVGIAFYFYRGNTYGIPHGIYVPLDENGEKLEVVLEDKWIIRSDNAEYRYVIGTLIEEEGKIYFYCDKITPACKYEMSYDKETEILTVYMPEKLGDGEIKAWKFK